MSRQDEIDKMYFMIKRMPIYALYWQGAVANEVSEKERREQTEASATFLVDNGIRSKDGFEIEYGISPNLGLSAIGIKPVDYGEEKNEHTQ